jgi:hypothetical protein
MPNNVDHPSHYNQGSIEVIDAIEDWKLGFHAGNVVKYVARSPHKNGIEDLKKARWYLDRLIQLEESKCQSLQPVSSSIPSPPAKGDSQPSSPPIPDSSTAKS